MNSVMRKLAPLVIGAIAFTAVSVGQASATVPVDPTLGYASSDHMPDIVQPVWWHHYWGWHRWGYWHRPWGWGWHRWGYWHRPWGWGWGWHRRWCYWHPRACGW